MSLRLRMALTAACCITLFLGLAGGFLYWSALPDKDQAYRLRQNEIARKQAERAKQAAKALPYALPNSAPAAVAAPGPGGKVLPIHLTWQDERGEPGGILDEFDGCIMAGSGVDVFWRQGDLYVMKQKGRLRRVWSAGRDWTPYGWMQVPGTLGYVCYDGKFVWAALSGFDRAPRLVVLDPQSLQTWEIDFEDVPRHSNGNVAAPPQTRPQKEELQLPRRAQLDPGFAIAPWQRGTVVVAGWPGQKWLAMLSFDPQRGKSVEPLPEPIDLEQKQSELLPNGQQRLFPAGMWSFSERAAGEGRKSRRLLIGNSGSPAAMLPAWSVEPKASRFDPAGGASMSEAMRNNRLAVDAAAVYWVEHAPVGNPRAVLACAKLPEFSEQVALIDVPDGYPTLHDGWLWLLGDACWRLKPEDQEVQSIKVDFPWTFGFRKPAQKIVRNDVYYSFRQACSSQHCGLLVTTSRQEVDVYGRPGKVFQLGLADDPRLDLEPSSDLASANAALAADAPPGTIVSLLEVIAPQKESADQRPIAALGPAIEIGDVPEDVGLPILAREIVRQSLLLAARDSQGWLTRDAVLHEALPEEKRAAARYVLSMRFPFRTPAVFELRLLDAQGMSESVWKEELEIYTSAEAPCLYEKLTKAAERWSREAFPKLLEQAGLRSVDGQPPGETGVPASAEKQLEQLTFAAQFMALEELHDAIRRQGTSPAVVGALVRGYANLGVLTEYHWTAIHKACKARALLYAQQLAAAKPDSAWAWWHRAYAEALAGIHSAAQSDLAAADKCAEPAVAGGAAAAQEQRPEWVDLLAAFCRFDDETLAAVAKDARSGQLAGLLQFLTVERLKHSEPVQDLMQRLLDENRECYRIHDARSSSGELGTLHESTLEAPAVLQEAIPKRLRNIQGLPPNVTKLLNSEERSETLLADLIATLLAVDQDEDGDELSWRMLGGLIEETQFIQLWRRARFMRDQWSVPVDQFVNAVEPLLGAHRYRALFNLYRSSPQPQAAAELENKLDLSDLDFEQQAEFAISLGRDWQTRRPEQYLAAAKRPEQHMDDVHRDFLALLAWYDGQAGESPSPETVRRMRTQSPDSPDVTAAWIRLNEPGLRSQIPELERRFARRQQVWEALIGTYWNSKEDRIRVLRKCIELSHEYWAYMTLASTYHENREYDQYLAVLNEVLKQPSRGLEHARARVQIARHYMSEHQWDKAQPYAVEAAQTWALWAMACAAECYEGLGDDRNEGLWRERIVDRYPSQEDSLQLYFWFRRSGLGDAPALVQRLDPELSAWAEKAAPRQQHQIGVFYQLSGRPRQALDAYRKAANDLSDLRLAYTARLRAALVAMEQDDEQVRDQELNSLTAIRDSALASFQKLGAWLERDLAHPKDAKADLAAARQLVSDADAKERPALNYAIGRYLAFRGQPDDDANLFLDAAASSPEARASLSRVLASAALRDRGATPSKLKTDPIVTATPSDKP